MAEESLKRDDTLVMRSDTMPLDEETPWGKLISTNQEKYEDVILKLGNHSAGRDTTCATVYDDERVSKVHFTLKRESVNEKTIRVALEDHSTNGVFINGQRLGKDKSKNLKNGDEIHILHPKIVGFDDRLGYVFIPAEGFTVEICQKPERTDTVELDMAASSTDSRPISPLDHKHFRSLILFDYLKPTDLLKVASLNKSFRDLAYDEDFWKKQCQSLKPNYGDPSGQCEEHYFPEEFMLDWDHRIGGAVYDSESKDKSPEEFVQTWRYLYAALTMRTKIHDIIDGIYFGFKGSEGSDSCDGVILILPPDSSSPWTVNDLKKALKVDESEEECPMGSEPNPWDDTAVDEYTDKWNSLRDYMQSRLENVKTYIVGEMGGLPYLTIGQYQNYLIGMITAVAWT
eukprot:CAMPEP_0115003504 /NCGR_PEP_ID=MMETSP0216-20121206/18652_1 /TAXON_ID=223996 /ORGANISM="Protocruzia adherens, Strain Boccale" /LENGTH=399 /DNA_ID=CAMNT_0002369325 /DNA_START=34 /DNA_END=1233 /DNA_ORIENTATION=+